MRSRRTSHAEGDGAVEPAEQAGRADGVHTFGDYGRVWSCRRRWCRVGQRWRRLVLALLADVHGRPAGQLRVARLHLEHEPVDDAAASHTTENRKNWKTTDRTARLLNAVLCWYRIHDELLKSRYGKTTVIEAESRLPATHISIPSCPTHSHVQGFSTSKCSGMALDRPIPPTKADQCQHQLGWMVFNGIFISNRLYPAVSAQEINSIIYPL